MAKQTVETVFKYAVDKNSIDGVERAAAELEAALNSARGELAQYGTTSRQAMSRVESAIEAGTRALREQEAAIDRVGQSYDEAAAAAKRASSAGGGMSSVDKIDRIGSVGSQIASGLGQGELANVLGLVGDLAGGFDSLGLVMGGVGLAVAGATAIFNHFAAQAEEAAKRAEAAINAQFDVQQSYVDAITGGMTSTEAQAAVERLSAVNEVLQKQYEELAAVAPPQPDFTAYGVLGEFNNAQEVFEQFKTRLQEIQTEIDKNNQLADRYVFGIEAGTFAINDRTQAEEDAAAASQRWMDARWQNEQSFREKIDSMDAEARGERIREIEREIDRLKEWSLEQGISDAQRQELVTSELLLRQERNFLLDVTRTTADAENELAAARNAQSERTDAYLDSITRVVEAEEASAKAKKELADAEAANAAKLKEIEDAFKATQADLETKHKEDLAKIEADGGKERERIAKDFAKRRADIEKQMDDAVAARDQVAYDRLKDQHEKTKDEEEDAQKELEVRLAEQRKTLKDSYDKQLADARAAADKSIAQEKARWDTERATRQNAVNQAQVDLMNALINRRWAEQTFYADQAVIQQNAYANLTSMAFTAGQSIVQAFDAGVQLALFQAGVAGGTGAGSIGTPTGPQPSPFSADFVPRAGGGGFLPSLTGGAVGGLSIPIAINGAGMSRRAVLDAVEDQLNERLVQSGWAA